MLRWAIFKTRFDLTNSSQNKLLKNGQANVNRQQQSTAHSLFFAFQFHRAECVFYAKSLGKKTLNHSQKQRCNNSERNCRGEEGFLQGPYSNSLSHLDLVSCEEGYTTLSSSASKLGHFLYCCTLYTTKIVRR